MKKTIVSVAVIAMMLLTNAVVMAQKADSSEKLIVSLSLNHDAFFGFNPSLAVAYPISSKADFTAYGILWGAGTARAWGNWTEFGLGVNFKAGNFGINPQLGFTMGNLLSSGTAGRGVVGDGIVPNLTVNYADSKIIGQLYAGYYGALRNETVFVTDPENRQSTLNYLHYWLNVGGKITPWLSLGAHAEVLNFAGGKINGGGTKPSSDVYQWVGPFVQLSKGVGGMRFSYGADLKEPSGSDFYKMSFFYNF